MRLVIDETDQSNVTNTAKINIYFHDVQQNRAKIIAQDVLIHKITSAQFEML